MAAHLNTASIVLPCRSFSRFLVQDGTRIPAELDQLLKLVAIVYEHIEVEAASTWINLTPVNFEIIQQDSQLRFLEHQQSFSHGPPGQPRHDNGLIVRTLRQAGIDNVDPIELQFETSVDEIVDREWKQLNIQGLSPHDAAILYLFLSEQRTFRAHPSPVLAVSPGPASLGHVSQLVAIRSSASTPTVQPGAPMAEILVPNLSVVPWSVVAEARRLGSPTAFRNFVGELLSLGTDLGDPKRLQDAYQRRLLLALPKIKPLALLGDAWFQCLTIFNAGLGAVATLAQMVQCLVSARRHRLGQDWLGLSRMLVDSTASPTALSPGRT